MGIPKFFRYISERYPCLSEILKEYQIPEFDNLYLDMNGIIHNCSHPNDSDIHFRLSEDEIFKNIFHYVEILFRMIQPQKLFFMAIDGVAPRAKINQQRGRRFRSAKEAETLEAKARAKGEEIPKDKRFDSNCITPGTLFMAKLNEQLKDFITYKVSTDKSWQKCKIVFSGSEVPGEGEHKIMDYIRYTKSQPGYDPNMRHCLYGLDADLIMLGLCTHEPFFSLLREEVKFGKKQKKICIPEGTNFCVLHLSLLRDYINHEFSILKNKLPFHFDIEKIIDDWVLMGFLVGNDFIPHLPNLHIAQGALPVLHHVYMEVLPTLGGYINEAGKLNLDRFEKFMEKLSRIDIEQFAEHYADLKYFEAKTGCRLNDTEGHNHTKVDSSSLVDESPKKTSNKELDSLIKSTSNMLLEESDNDELDDESDSEIYNLEFVQHKRDYYMQKLEYDNVNADVLRSQAEGYVRAIQWNLHYYYDGCCSWSWYYPHHYAPYISDIKDFKNLNLEFELGEPFLPFQQLLAVLPAYSKDLLPEAFQTLLTEEESPIIDYYPVDFKTDLNGKRQEWEAVVLIPFIEEKSLLDAMGPHCSKLTEEERERNKPGPMIIYTYSEEDFGISCRSKYFPPVKSHARAVLVNREDILVPKERLIKGLYPGLNLDAYFPGFPSLRYIKHTASLEKAKVRVFEQPSREENMILHITETDTPDLKAVAANLLGKIVNVDWPTLTEALVVAVSNSAKKINLINSDVNSIDNNVKEEEMTGPLVSQWNIQKKHVEETYKGRRGIDIGKTSILIHARPLIGSKYIFGPQGKLYLEKQWYTVTSTYAYQTIVTNIQIHNTNSMLFKTANEVFAPKTVCFMLGHPHYGAMGEVIEPGYNISTGRVSVSMKTMPEPCLDPIKKAQTELKTQYMHGSIAAQRLGISSHLLSRITGTIYVIETPSESQTGFTKHNVGLNLKFNKRNEEIPGYTKKVNGQWLYSAKAIDLIRSYMTTCPDFFEKIAKNISDDNYCEDDLFGKGSNRLTDILEWLKQQEFHEVESRACGTEVLDTNIVQAIEIIVDAYMKTECYMQKLVLMRVKPNLLFKPGLHLRNCAPDPKSQNRLLDRIVCVRNSFTVPLGLKGTIIGIQKAEESLDTMYEVLFDKPFEGGLEISGCSKARGYRLTETDFINISYGEKVERRKDAPEAQATVTDSWRRPIKSQNQTSMSASAFASFNKNINKPQTVPTIPVTTPNVKRENPSEIYLTDEKNQARNDSQISSWRQQRPKNQSAETVFNSHKSSTEEAGPYNQRITTNPSCEFQALWNELHKLQKPSTSSEHATSTLPSGNAIPLRNEANKNSPQDPSAYLKAVLKIDENVQNIAPSPTEVPVPKVQLRQPAAHKPSDAPPLVQQLFDHARQSEKQQQTVINTPYWYSSQLMSHFQLSGLGMPRYSYITDDKTKMIRAQIFLPDARFFTGDFCDNLNEATENAAKKVYKELKFSEMLKPDMKLLLRPPQKWFNNQQTSWTPNMRPPPMMPCQPKIHPGIPNPMMHFPKWTPNIQQNARFVQMVPQNIHVANQPNYVQQNAQKPEVKNTTPFVPLQAQKKSRNAKSKQTAQEIEKHSKCANVTSKHENKEEVLKAPTTTTTTTTLPQGAVKDREVPKSLKNAPSSQASQHSLDKSQQKHHQDDKCEIKSRTFTSTQLQKKNRSANSKQNIKEAEHGRGNPTENATQHNKEQTLKATKAERVAKGEKDSVAQGVYHASKSQKSDKPRRSRVAAKFGAPPIMNGSEKQSEDNRKQQKRNIN